MDVLSNVIKKVLPHHDLTTTPCVEMIGKGTGIFNVIERKAKKRQIPYFFFILVY